MSTQKRIESLKERLKASPENGSLKSRIEKLEGLLEKQNARNKKREEGKLQRAKKAADRKAAYEKKVAERKAARAKRIAAKNPAAEKPAEPAEQPVTE